MNKIGQVLVMEILLQGLLRVWLASLGVTTTF